jgi:alpha-galactosidase
MTLRSYLSAGRLLVLAILLWPKLASAQKFPDLALTPPMGWNSWNRFECDGINETVIRETADAMVSSGMKEVGYEYIVIDDCWQVGRDAGGNILADPEKFPSGIKALAAYVHGRGLKFGIYTCAGVETCAKRPGSRGHEYQDARQYASWGVDYVKVDWCNTSTQDARASYTLFRDAIYAAGRPMVLSICEWGLNQPWLWAGQVGHLWRTTGDIRNNWGLPDAKEGKVWGGGVTVLLDMQAGLDGFAGPGRWNDPDMLEVGNGALTRAEERAHFSLWAMLAAPLMAGNDLRHMSNEVRDILTNREVIVINQDPVGRQGYKIVDEDWFEVFVKPLSRGDMAVCFFNRGAGPRTMVIEWEALNLPRGHRVRDLWRHEEVGRVGDPMEITIGTHDVVLFRLIAEAPPR